MDGTAQTLLTLGALLLVGLIADEVSRILRLPRVTILLVLGFAVGSEGLDLLPEATEEWFPIVSTVALTMVGFLLGGELTVNRLRTNGRADITIATTQGVATASVVCAGLLLVGVEPVVALSLAGIAVATAPAATLAVVQERRADGPFTRTLLTVVALDDVIALSLFGLLVSTASLLGSEDGGLAVLGDSLWEIFGALALGVGLGLPAASLTGRLKPGLPTQEEAYCIVLLCAGGALALEVSFLLAAVALGATIASRATHHEIPFQEIERIEWPALIVFFVLAGASLELSSLSRVGWLGLGYVALRSVGKVGGCGLGGHAAGLTGNRRWWLGATMLPQAGVAIGLSLLAADRFPAEADDILAVVISATVLFELIGPILTGVALHRVGEAGRATGADPARPWRAPDS